MKRYRRHNCTTNHRTYTAFARCIFRNAAWIDGNGPIALIAWCRIPTVTLHGNLQSAEQARRTIDNSGCGGHCTKRHEIVELVLPTPQ